MLVFGLFTRPGDARGASLRRRTARASGLVRHVRPLVLHALAFAQVLGPLVLLAPRAALAGPGLDAVIAEQQIKRDFAAPVRVNGTPADQSVLTYQASSGTWVAGAGGGGGGPFPTNSNWSTVLANGPNPGHSGAHSPIIDTGQGIAFGTAAVASADAIVFGAGLASLIQIVGPPDKNLILYTPDAADGADAYAFVAGAGIGDNGRGGYGGSLYMAGGFDNGDGGSITLHAGDSQLAHGGSGAYVLLYPGIAATGFGGLLDIQGGPAFGSNATPGGVLIHTGGSTGTASSLIEFQTSPPGTGGAFVQNAEVSRVKIDGLGSVVLNSSGVALVTTATDGFTAIPTCPGTPTGVPSATAMPTGTSALLVDSTNGVLYFRSGGAWLASSGVAQSLAQVLAVGNSTGGHNINVSAGDQIIGSTGLQLVSITSTINLSAGDQQISINASSNTQTSGTVASLSNSPTVSDGGANSTTVLYTEFLNPTINFTGGTRTGHYEALAIQAIETSLPTGTNYLIRAQAGAAGTTDRFSVDNSGNVRIVSGGLAFHNATPVADSIVSAAGVGFRVASGGNVGGDLTLQPLDSTTVGSIGGASLLKGGKGNGAGFGGAVSVVGGTGAALGGLALIQGGSGQTPGDVTLDTGTSTSTGVGTITFKASPGGAAGATVGTIVGNQQKLSGTHAVWTVNPAWVDGGSASSGANSTLFVNPSYNYTGTSSAVLAAFQIDAVETSLPASGSPTHYLIRARAGVSGATDEFYVTNVGNTYANSFTGIAGGTIGFSAVGSVGLNPADTVISRLSAHVLQVGTSSTPNGNGFLVALGLGSNDGTTSGINMGYATTGRLTGGSATVYGWTATDDTAALDLGLSRKAAGVLQLMNPGSLTSSAALRVYNTTDAASGAPTNAEWLETAWSGNLCTITTAKAGSGTLRLLNIEAGSGGVTVRSPNGANYFTVDDTGGNHFFCVQNGDLWARNGITCGSTAIGSHTFAVSSTGVINQYFNVSAVGWGVPAIYGSGRATAQTAANTSVATYTCGAADGSFLVSANVNVTTSGTFSINVQVTYTDETNAAQTETLTFTNAGVLLTAISNVQGVGAFEGIPIRLRAKAGTAITVKTAGTFTSVTYNVEADITQVK